MRTLLAAHSLYLQVSSMQDQNRHCCLETAEIGKAGRVLQALQGHRQLWEPLRKNVYHAEEAKTESAKLLAQYLIRCGTTLACLIWSSRHRAARSVTCNATFVQGLHFLLLPTVL